MIKRNKYPILEFDPCKIAKLEPKHYISDCKIPEKCVITYFRNAIELFKMQNLLEQITYIHTDSIDIPIYKFIDKPICIVLGYVGAAGAAASFEELIALGARRFIVCGNAGVLKKGLEVGSLLLPTAAIRDEGVSYHYIEPSREIECDSNMIEKMEKYLRTLKVPYRKVKTWTTDAFYRETQDKIDLRIADGCSCVEMEAAAYFSVAKFRDVELGQVLCSSDDLSGVVWDKRNINNKAEVQSKIVDICIDMCLNI